MKGRIVGLLAVAIVIGMTTAAGAWQCAPYAREVSGVSLRGDAWTWWSSAAGLYERGQRPAPGSVIVFKRHGKMRHGHVAVVTHVVNSREILVEHANWASRHGRERGQVTTRVAITDVSGANDWTSVRVWNRDAEDFGARIYPTFGFIYPPSVKPELMKTKMGPHDMHAPRRSSSVMPTDGHHATEADLVIARNESQLPRQKAEEERISPLPAQPVKFVEKPVQPVKLAEKTVAPPAAAVDNKAPDGVWEQDAILAKRFGSGRYGSSS